MEGTQDDSTCNFFQFDNNFFQQINGTPMGSPISPLFADIVMVDLEEKCLLKLSECNVFPILYKRYVDDTFFCIKKSDVDFVISSFNSLDFNIKFTYELEVDNRINFLDMTLLRENNRIITNWFQKPTSSGRLLNFKSNHTSQLKRNVIYNLVDRAILLSDARFHRKNIEIVKKIARNNYYEEKFIDTCVKKRIQKIEHKNVSDQERIRDVNPFAYISIPYERRIFYNIKKIFQKYNICVVPQINKKLDKFIIRGKDRTKKLDNTNVIYQINCMSCPATYIGETKRALSNRIHEHKNNKCQNSVVSLHNKNHVFDWENVMILDYESVYKKRIVSEMIHINIADNTINKKEDVDKLSSIYKNLFKSIRNVNRLRQVHQ